MSTSYFKKVLHQIMAMLKNAYFVTTTILITLITTLITFWFVYTRQMTRPRADGIIRAWSRALLNQVKVRRIIVGNAPDDMSNPTVPTIIMSNHSSLYDIPLIFDALPGSIRMLTKKELFKIPLFGGAMRNNEFIMIDRTNRQQAFENLQQAQKKMKEGIILWAAPEGTRSKTGELLPFKKGIFHTAIDLGARIVPVGIRHANRILPKHSLHYQLDQTVEIHIGKPIDASLYAEDQKELLIQQVRTAIESLLKTPSE